MASPARCEPLILTGMWSGSLVGCLGVGGVDCESVSEYERFAASYAPTALTVGVPACAGEMVRD